MITVCLSLVLVVILFKLYQTYQPQPSPYQASNNSFTSLDTQISSFHSQVELQPVFNKEQVWTSTHGREGLRVTVGNSHTCDLLYKDVCTEESDPIYRNREELTQMCRGHSASFFKSDIKVDIQKNLFLFNEQKEKGIFTPHFQEKWQFPKYMKNHHHQKYLSL